MSFKRRRWRQPAGLVTRGQRLRASTVPVTIRDAAALLRAPQVRASAQGQQGVRVSPSKGD